MRTSLQAKQITQEQIDRKELEDEFLDILLMCYFCGEEQALEDLGIRKDDLPFADEDSYQTAEEVIFRKIAGKTFADRIDEYVEAHNAQTAQTEDAVQVSGADNQPIPPIDSLIKVLDTEAHRDYEQAAVSTAKANGATMKTWNTMSDDRVRDTHRYLEGITVGIDDYFYTVTGDRGQCPGDFEDPAEVVNCRCFLSFSK